MKNDNWSASERKVHVSSRLPPCPATDFVAPDIKRVATEIKADSEEFVPEYGPGENAAVLLANIPSGFVSFSSGSSETIDCGFSIKVPAGYKVVAQSDIPSLFFKLADSERLKVNAFNTTSSKLVLAHKQAIGRIWIEPVYLFEWRMK